MIFHEGNLSSPTQRTSERLHARIVRVLILLTTLPIVIGAIVSLAVSIINSRIQVAQTQHSMAVSVGNMVHHQWQNALSSLRIAAASAEQSPANHFDAAILPALQRECPACDTIWLIDTTGRVFQQIGRAEARPVLDARQRAALARGDELIPTRPSPAEPTSSVLVLIPFRRAGVSAGALLARLNLQELGGEALTLLEFDPQAYSYVTDRNGRLLISPDLARTGSRVDLRSIPLVKAALNGTVWQPPQSQAYTGLLAARVDGTWYRIDELDWYVFVEAPQAILTAHNWTLFGVQAFLLLITSSTAILLGRRLAASMTHPLEQLHEGVDRLRAGTWGQPLPIVRFDEIGHLAHTFNLMAQDLKSKRDDLVARGNELRLANQELEQALTEARSANLLKSQFVATISHELRTPLTAMLGFSEMLEMDMYGSLQGEQRDTVTRIRANGQHLLELINDLLDFSKLEAGKLKLYEEQFILRDLFISVLDMCSPAMNAKGLHMQLVIESDVPALIMSDPLRLRQILVNLLTNAIKFTEQGGITLHVAHYRPEPLFARIVGQETAYDTPAAHSYLRIDVIDTGIGIAPADHASIFELFRQVDGDYTRQQGGIGLGLAITRHLVELMRGTITVSSELGSGSCFTITLPLRAGTASKHVSEVHTNE